MTQQQIEHWLAMVTVAMPFILAAAHGLRRFATYLHAHAKSTADKGDDKVTQRLVDLATWLDVTATFIATASSGGLSRQPETVSTPSIERVEGGS
jgi:hypothetical protein